MTFEPDTPLTHAVCTAHNREPRRGGVKPSLLVLHYTGMGSAAKAIDWLSRPESGVSCHYVVDEHGVVTQLVPEELRAWHAGVSNWKGETDINSHSIGIEIHNPGHQNGYPDFPAAQMRSVIALSKDIVARNHIRPENILAHSDVAPGRKIDPGEKFNWLLMAREGLGLWVRPLPVRADDPGLELGAEGPRVLNAQKNLAAYGYGLDASGVLDADTEKVLKAFQLHFRPRRVDGRLDRSTEGTLERLVAASSKPAAA
ncbi:N-acetylmuramoyl-L-alanine amidase [Hyphomicrobium sp. B1]|uniref:N-acetylmuramoyl-L-alanine amidase n=1 Tax=Hyphomicrobium sp. B1 TaxID=3075651 RepID=UPI003C2C4FFF